MLKTDLRTVQTDLITDRLSLTDWLDGRTDGWMNARGSIFQIKQKQRTVKELKGRLFMSFLHYYMSSHDLKSVIILCWICFAVLLLKCVFLVSPQPWQKINLCCIQTQLLVPGREKMLLSLWKMFYFSLFKELKKAKNENPALILFYAGLQKFSIFCYVI